MRGKAGTRPPRGAKRGRSYAQPSGRATRQAQPPESLVAFNDAKWAATLEADDDIEGSSPCTSDDSDSEGCSTALSNSVASPSPSELTGVPVDEESKRAKEALDKEAEEEEALALRIAEEQEVRDFVDLQRSRTSEDKAAGETLPQDDQDEDFLPGLSSMRLSHGSRPKHQQVEEGQMLRSEATRHAARRALGDRLRHDVRASGHKSSKLNAAQPTPAMTDIDAILEQSLPEHQQFCTGQNRDGAEASMSSHALRAPRASRHRAIPKQGDDFLESFISS